MVCVCVCVRVCGLRKTLACDYYAAFYPTLSLETYRLLSCCITWRPRSMLDRFANVCSHHGKRGIIMHKSVLDLAVS